MLKNRRGEMGIGTLIIFISLLLVAAIAAGVLIQTSGSLQEKALTTGDEARSQISTNARVIEVAGTDGSDGGIDQLTTIMKLAPGSDAIKLGEALVTINTFDKTSTLKYAGEGADYDANSGAGYYTFDTDTIAGGPDAWEIVRDDYDGDGSADSITGGAGGANAELDLSGSGSNIVLGSCAADVFTNAFPGHENITNITGDCDADNVTSITFIPETEGDGVFAVQYLQKGSNWVDGNLQRGDVVKVYTEAPRELTDAENVRINFVPKIGTPTLTQFITPEVISTYKVYLYP